MRLVPVLLLAALAGAALAAPARADAPALPDHPLLLQTDAGEALYARGRAAAFDFRMAEARAAFAELGRLEPGSPAAAYGLESAALWQALVMERDPFASRFFALNDSLKDVLDGLPRSPEVELLKAQSGLHRALLLGRQERYSKAGLAFRGACGRFYDLADEAGTPPAVGFGNGLCQVVAGSVPRSYRWLARLFGFSGTVGGGLDALTLAADAADLDAVEATFTLAIVDETLNEGRREAIGRLDSLEAGAVGDYLHGYLLLLDRDADAAEERLRAAARALDAPGADELPFVDAHLGMALFRQNRFEEAAPVLERFVRAYRGKALVAQTTLLAGLAREMTGDRRRAVALYDRVRALRDYDSDLSAEREARARLAAPMTPSERALLRGRNAYDAGRYAEAVDTLRPVVTDRELPQAERAEAAYRTGRAYQAQEAWDNAQRHFVLARDRPGDALAKWGPWSEYHLGEVYEATGAVAEARAAYRRVLANEDEFDYHKALEQRTRTALERLD